MLGGVSHKTTRKRLNKVRYGIRSIKYPFKTFKSRNRGVKKEVQTDIVMKYGTKIPIYVPNKLNCNYREEYYMSGRTNDVLSVLKGDTIKKRIFYVSSHACLSQYINITPKQNVIIQTGELCSLTSVSSDRALFSIFNSKDKLKAFDIFFGLYGPAGPFGKNSDVTKSVYSSLNMHLPYEFFPNKSLSYTSDEKKQKNITVGIFENKLDSDVLAKDLFKYPIFTLYDSSGMEIYTDYLFTREGGVQTSTIIDLINSTYKDTINIVMFSSCSIIHSCEEPANYSMISTLMRRPTFYSLDNIKENTMDKMIFVSDKTYVTVKTSRKNKKYLHQQEIPKELNVILVDTNTKCKFKVYNIETIWWVIQNLPVSRYIIRFELFNYIYNTENNSSSSLEYNENNNQNNTIVRKPKRKIMDTIQMPLTEYISSYFFNNSKEVPVDFVKMYQYIIEMNNNNKSNTSYNSLSSYKTPDISNYDSNA